MRNVLIAPLPAPPPPPSPRRDSLLPNPAQGPIILPTQNSKSLPGSRPILNEPIDVIRTDAALPSPV